MKYLLNQMLVLCVMLMAVTQAMAQQTTQPEMADAFRQDGKIYVVVAVALTVLTALFVYVFLLDRKISTLEKKNS